MGDSTGSASSLDIRCSAIAELRNGGPINTRRSK